ncbi:argininosuccinate lyase [Aureimonas altamirensis DSM 21988]|uniref:argininosuccinate lyase n=2 Tax=Aureimonas altamirensis TaxID=370622 RepID=A0A0P0YWZ6_9HYPH|nr:argininosuccinate lyase [Aureimonas altamirensis]BAT25949.1 argininosuccinate lyase [Aureimonas altamirensis]SHI76780.1 argininosuccinate lyase [Aureimonas altamirensis DSM 21988]
MVEVWDRGLRPLYALGCVTGLAAILCGPASAQDGVRDEFFWLGQINKATAVINTQEGLLDKEKTPGIAKAIDSVIKAGNEPGAKRPATVITFEPLLIEEGGVEVTLLHAGRSSQDMHATYRAAILRDRLLDLATQLNVTSRTLVDLAATHADTIVPNYTNGVAAQPNSYGHYLLGHAAGFARDADRIREAYARVDRSAMGTTVLNGTGWPLNRQRMADYLGFAGVVDNAYDASQIASMDQPVEIGSIVTAIALHSGNFVEDVMTQYAQTRPWILLQEGGGNTYVSSAMPQKRNPGLLNNTRSQASTAITLAIGPMIQAHNITPGMPDPKDVEANSEMVDAGVKTLADLDKVLKALVISPERALEELNADWTASQEIADILMRDHGLPFREGHHVASEIVTYARAEGIGPLDFPYEKARKIYAETVKDTDFAQELPLSEAEFRAALDPVAIVRGRATSGGPQPEEMKRMLDEATARLDGQESWAAEQRAHIDAALGKLDADFQSLLTR